MMTNKLKNILQNVKKDKNFHELLSGSLISFIATSLALVLGLVLNLIITRYYGAKELGIYSIISSIFAITLIFSILGINTSILRLLPEQIVKYSYGSAYKLFWKVFKIVLITSSIVAIVVYTFAQSIADNIFHKTYLYPLLSLTAFIIIFQALGNLSIASIRALKNIKLYAFFQIFSPLLQILALIFLSILLYQEFNSIYALMLSYIISGVFSLYAVRKLFVGNRTISDDIYNLKSKYILFISLPMMMGTVMSLIVTQTDILMLGSMRAAEEVGIYAISAKLAMLSTSILTSVNIVIAPKISELYYSNQLDELQKLVQKTTKLISLISLPVVIILIVFGKFILSFFGDEFIIGYTALFFLLIGQSLSIISGPTEFFLNMTGHQKNLNYISITCAILNIILNYLLIPIYGLEGAAFASMVSLIAIKIFALVYIKIHFGYLMMYFPVPRVNTVKKFDAK